MRGKHWHNEPGPITNGRTWRTSTVVPEAICIACWAPFLALKWLVGGLWPFMGFILSWATISILATILLTWEFVGWLESAMGITVLIVAIVTTYLCFREGWQRRD
jgi:hypothetical protein